MSDNKEKNTLENTGGVVEEKPTAMPGLTAAMEVAGVESIPNTQYNGVVLGFSREE